MLSDVVAANAALAKATTEYLQSLVPAPTPDPVPAPAPAPPPKPIGFATGYPAGLAFDKHYSLDTFIQHVKDTGANFLRFDVPNLANDSTYAGTIARVKACKAAGFHVSIGPTFDGNATTYSSFVVGAINALAAAGVPLDSNDWIEFGNELNLSGPRLSPEAYAPWHRAVFNAVRATGTTAQISTAGFATYGQYGSTGSGIDMVLYVERMLAADPKLGECFNALACHPYYFNNDDTVANLENQTIVWNGLGDALSHTHSLLTALDAYPASAGKPLLFNEVGVDTDELPWSGGVSEAVQAQYYGDLVKMVRTNSRLAGLALYSVLDKPEEISTGTTREGSFGVFHPDWTVKPSFATFKAAVSA